MSDAIRAVEPAGDDVAAEPASEAVELPSSYRLRFPVQFGSERIEELTLKANGRAMQGFKVQFQAKGDDEGGVVLEPYRFAELGLRLAGKPRAILDMMHPCDQFGLGTVTLGFFTHGPPTGKTPSL